MRTFFLSVVLTLAVGCASAPPAIPRHIAPPVTMRLHGDVEFSEHERALISWAVFSLRQQSDGAIDVQIVYDLDGTPIKEPRLVRSHSNESIFFILEELKNGTLYGLSLIDSAGPRAYLLADRLYDDIVWVHTAMHELLHLYGADHVVDPKAVLYLRTGQRWHNGLELTEADRDEIARVLRTVTPSAIKGTAR